MELEDEERNSLAGLLLENLDTEVEKRAVAAWLEEIERRIVALDAGDAKWVPSEDVRNQLLKSQEVEIIAIAHHKRKPGYWHPP